MSKFDYLKQRVGNFKILLNGLCVKPPHLTSLIPLIFIIFMLSAPTFAFSTWKFKDLWMKIFSTLFFAMCIGLTFIGMFWVSFSDPGIIPKNLIDVENKENFNTIKVLSETYEMKICKSCNII